MSFENKHGEEYQYDEERALKTRVTRSMPDPMDMGTRAMESAGE